MKKVAIIVDGGFLSKIFSRICEKELSPENIVSIAKKIIDPPHEELFRIYYYDAFPYEPDPGQKIINPLNKREMDFENNPKIVARKNFFKQLASMDYIALRKGEVRAFGWKLKNWVLKDINEGVLREGFSLKGSHLDLNMKQKGVDMRIGLDIATISTKHIVDKISIISADTDFIPAMKHARKEGTIVAIVDIGGTVRDDLKHHADQILKVDLKTV